ncbi:small GTPase rab5 [Tritrichomonas foetus]|uniref:Small GTPase rab5 n=1 Tax=Tritrichomonas foetus TaxID=1144522 RepID=A0A1J4JIM6_9EUKA|nr:small GTPase rab5 [Tritrichomonas foetus]|eukprot:OHS99002.1 small GTPase rab5 [Tritrichomonas foetus]
MEQIQSKFVTPTLKVVIVGDTFVGKTSIIQKYHENIFEDCYVNTVGTAFQSVDVPLPSSSCTHSNSTTHNYLADNNNHNNNHQNHRNSSINQSAGTQYNHIECKNAGQAFTSQNHSMNHSMNNSPSSIRLHIWDTAGQERYANLGQLYYRKANIVLLVFDISSLLSFKNLKNRRIPSVMETAPEKVKYILVGNKIDRNSEREVSDEKISKLRQKYNIPIYIETSAKTGQGISKLFQTIAEQFEFPKYEVNLPSVSIKNTTTKENNGCC